MDGQYLWKMLMITTEMKMNKNGIPTHCSVTVPAMERPKTVAGKMRNMIIRANMANHRYLAVTLPKNLAIGMGKRMNGMG
ncbi:Uncharacterized protein APZ42_016125 [Daphnia magna]|uniref:Uncharacterized protein n=1 Tax=Daphnia magna TaxID=35525 RepID=A0A162NKY5_9CRUS|nr:Uncharacterized protein APZ42_016125 [Daphnia magna]